jgi:hypothetical protein
MKNRNLDNSDNWATPTVFYEKLNAEFNFDFDPCPLNHDMSWDGLQVGWGKSNFINSPYSRKLKEAFINKAVAEMSKGNLSVMLLPVSTSTKIFHDVVYPNCSEIRFVKSRIAFQGFNTKGEYVDKNKGMHDSMIVVFDPQNKNNKKVCLFAW